MIDMLLDFDGFILLFTFPIVNSKGILLKVS